MKTKTLAFLLSLFLLVGCLCGCDTVTEEPTEPTASSDSSSPVDDTEAEEITTTTQQTTTTKITATTKPTEQMVWIPSSGSKYHKTSTCSNMSNPKEVTLSYAEVNGFTPCKRCYK